jgi:hypothetical protein
MGACAEQAPHSDSAGALVDSGEIAPPSRGDAEMASANDASTTEDASAPDDTDAGMKDMGPYGNRVTSGLLALYDFEDGEGNILHDKAEAPCNLTITDETKVTWQPHKLTINASTIIQSKFPPTLTKITNACSQTNEIAIEAWVESATTSESTYAPIVTMADSNSTTQNFALGTYASTYKCGILNLSTCHDYPWWASVQPGNDLNAGTVTADLTHLVTTRVNGILSFYVNGVLAGTQPNTASFADWESYPLTLGNVPQSGQGWQGTLHLVAIYGRALSADDINTNFNAGADPIE